MDAAQPMVGRVEENVALKGARRFAVEAKLWEGCFKGFRVADAELDLDLNRLHGRSLYRRRDSPSACLTEDGSFFEIKPCGVHFLAALDVAPLSKWITALR